MCEVAPILRVVWVSVALAYFYATPARSAAPSALQRPELQTPGATRTLSGVVRNQWRHRPIANASVRLAGTQLRTSTDSTGSWTLAGLPTGPFLLEAVFIGYRQLRVPIPASPTDSGGLTLDLEPYGGPDSSITEPLPKEDLRPVLEAVIAYLGPSLDRPNLLVVLDTSGVSVWKEVPPQWQEGWLDSKRITAVCGDWRTPDCRSLGTAGYVVMRTLPRRLSQDTAFATIQVTIISAKECEKHGMGGHQWEEAVRIVRLADDWHGETFPYGPYAFSHPSCDAELSTKH